jgi:hypothetical protein
MPPTVAIVGSVDETRTFDPPVTDPARARQACAELGRELALAGWDIEVYSADAAFIEADVVRGYLSADAETRPDSIHVRAPLGKGVFAEVAADRNRFDLQADPNSDWEVSFYRHLVGSDAVLLVGGGQSTFIAGLIAVAIGLPVLPVAGLGGAATKVWTHLAQEKADAPADDVAEMAEGWSEDSAKRLVAGLGRQREARLARARREARSERQESRRAQTSILVAAVLLLTAGAGLAVAWGRPPGTVGSIVALMLVPTLSAAAGALIRTSLDVGRDWTRAGVLGGAVGLVSGLLYVASQLVGTPDILDPQNLTGTRRLLFFLLPIGFVAGLTFDAVYAKWRTGPDVSGTATLER